jgi:hypothetical protein
VDEGTAAAIAARVERGIAATEAFFGAPFPRRFRVEVFADRPALDRSFPKEWGLSQSQSWMVASGVATDLRILSPRVWSTEASGHDAADERHVQGIVTHELVHVFHGQHNPIGDFDGMDAMGWFLEGVAVLASGQLEEGHVAPASEALAEGRGPRQLATAWSGKYRYGVSGSLVEYVDSLVGRATLRAMLAATTQQELLRLAGVTEAELLDGWARWVEGG